MGNRGQIGEPHVGVDLVHIPRIRALMEREEVLARMLTPGEIGAGDPAHIAGVIAAKEALFKALGVAPPRWQDVEVRQSSGGRPTLTFSPDLNNRVRSCDLSIAHDGEYAVACVVVLMRAP